MATQHFYNYSSNLHGKVNLGSLKVNVVTDDFSYPAMMTGFLKPLLMKSSFLCIMWVANLDLTHIEALKPL